MSKFAVNPTKDNPLALRLAALGVREADLEETFVRSGGHGGQNVNKTSTCVLLVHRPSGLWVKCQESRQQGMNRIRARELLAARLEALARARQAAALGAKAKLHRQKRGRNRAARLRMLADKAHQASKKSLRRRPIDE